jgi:hypothetical protein
MAKDCKFRIAKTIIKRVAHFCVLVIYVSPSLVSQAQPDRLSSPQSVLQVDTTVDSNALAYQVCSDQPDDCSLRGALSIANMSPEQEYLIELPTGVYHLSLPGSQEDANATGDLDVFGRVTLAGAAAETTQINGNTLDRVLQVHGTATVILQDLSITGGLAPPEGDGGGIYNQGNLTITRSMIIHNAAGSAPQDEVTLGTSGGSGGAIYNTGTLVIQDSQVAHNTTGLGGPGDCENPPGNGGAGGGIYNAGMLLIQGSQVDGNIAERGGYGLDQTCNELEIYYGVDGGDGGGGGAVFNTGSLIIIQTTVSNNSAGDGGNGGSSDRGGSGGSGGDGGAIFSTGSLNITQTTISSNTAGNGGAGGVSWMIYFGGGGGAGGDGGGIYSLGTLKIYASHLLSNRAGSGGGGEWSGPEGRGGGIYYTTQGPWSSKVLKSVPI